ncbi:hypothetical protein RI367_007115 [Sorochytrium milnesiophthora]
MASSTTDAVAEFCSAFQRQRQEITAAIAALSAASTQGSNSLDDDVTRLRQNISALEKETNAATLFLPQYDQRQCWEQLRDLTQQLEARKLELQPRKRFAFKTVKQANATPAHTSAPAPVHTPAAKEKPDRTCVLEGQALTISRWTEGSTRLTFGEPVYKDTSAAIDLELSHVAGATVYFPFPSAPPASSKNTHAPTAASDVSVPIFAAAHVNDVRSSTLVLLPPMEGSILLENIHDCVFRMHKSSGVKVYLRVLSDPIIEDCSRIVFEPLEYVQPLVTDPAVTEAVLKRAGHPPGQENRWRNVKDFNWLKNGQQSPNWSAGDEAKDQRQRAGEIVALL